MSNLAKILAILVWFTSTASNGEMIFSDNFDATPDWQNVGSQRCHWIGWDEDSNDTSCASVPLNYDLMYMTDKNPVNPMCQINNKGARGSSGKGLRVYDEAWFQNFSGTPGDSWSETLGDDKWSHIEIGIKDK